MRATPNGILSGATLALGTILALTAGLLFWGATFVDSQIKNQLEQQRITMPTDATGLSQLPQTDRQALRPYAGTPLDSGPKAKAYADHFISAHLSQLGQGRTFSEISGEHTRRCTGDNASHAATAQCQRLQSLSQTLFQGNTLKGLLSYAYAFSMMGLIARIAGWVVTLAAIGALAAGLLAYSRPPGSAGRHTAQ